MLNYKGGTIINFEEIIEKRIQTYQKEMEETNTIYSNIIITIRIIKPANIEKLYDRVNELDN